MVRPPATPTEVHVIAFLANLSIKVGQRVSAGPYSVCSSDDDLLKRLTPTPANRTAEALLQKFRNHWGTPFKPACLVSESAGKVPAEEVRDLRNICAVAGMIGGTACMLGRGQWIAHHSDHFDFYHFTPGLGGMVGTFDGPSGGASDPEGFAGTGSAWVHDPSNFKVVFDRVLLNQLIWAWEERHQRKSESALLIRVFRALEVAMHAGRFPSDGLTTLNDVGTRIALWVSAFEILLRPETGDVDKRKVQEALARVDWRRTQLKTEEYDISHRSKQLKVTYPEKVYDLLYSARNDFLHGNEVGNDVLRWRRPGAEEPSGLQMSAPCLFGAGLRAALAGHAPPPGDYDELLGLENIERALLGPSS